MFVLREWHNSFFTIMVWLFFVILCEPETEFEMKKESWNSKKSYIQDVCVCVYCESFAFDFWFEIRHAYYKNLVNKFYITRMQINGKNESENHQGTVLCACLKHNYRIFCFHSIYLCYLLLSCSHIHQIKLVSLVIFLFVISLEQKCDYSDPMNKLGKYIVSPINRQTITREMLLNIE